MTKIFFILSIFFTPPKKFFCTCIPKTIEESIERSDIIFLGKVLKVDTLKIIPEIFFRHNLDNQDSASYTFGHLVTLNIKKTFKGKAVSDTIKIMTGQGGGDCGYYFKLQTDYLIYADTQDYYLIDSNNNFNDNKLSSHQKKYFTTTDCDRTTNSIMTEELLLNAAFKIKQ